MAKTKLTNFADSDLRWTHTNILLLTDPSPEALECKKLIALALEDRGKEFLIEISKEEVRNGWKLNKQPLSPEMQAYLEKYVPEWQAKKE